MPAMPGGVGLLAGAYADFDHLAVVPLSWSAQQAHKRGGTPTGIHIGRQPRIRKGFVIRPTDRRSAPFHGRQGEPTVATPRAEAAPLCGLPVLGSRDHMT